MRNRQAPGLTENTDHGGRFQLKTPTSDSFLAKNSTGLEDLLHRDLTGPSWKITGPGQRTRA